MKKLSLLSTFTILFLLSPYLILLCYFAMSGGLKFSLSKDFYEAFGFTLQQALVSSIAATAIGIAGSLGLIGLRSLFGDSKQKSLAINLLVLLPSALPVLFVILAALNLSPSLKGFSGIVFLHVLINVGLVAVTFEAVLIERVGSYLELARVEGASLTRMIFKVIIPILKKEIILIWLSVFAFCFTSFAVPLVIGGSKATTIEVLIYELIRVDSNWADASLIAGLQSLFIFLLTFALVHTSSETFGRQTKLHFLGIKWFSLLVLLPTFIVLAGLLTELLPGINSLAKEISFSQLLSLGLNSFLIAIGTATLCLTSLLVIAYSQPSPFVRKTILGFLAPSSILTGFALLIVWRDVGVASLVKICIGLTMLFVPILYRLGWDAKLRQLRGQMQTAEILGASRWLSFAKVGWPQLQPTAAKLSALAAFWAWGDFALSKMVAEQTLSISLLVHSLMGSYRLSSATALVWLMFAGSAITYFIVWRAVNVASRKSTH